jgi:ribosomal protein L37AE/L43A
MNTEYPDYRNVKSCPNCQSASIVHRKRKGYYQCNICLEKFHDPVFKQIKDRRSFLAVPPILRKIMDDKHKWISLNE